MIKNKTDKIKEIMKQQVKPTFKHRNVKWIQKGEGENGYNGNTLL